MDAAPPPFTVRAARTAGWAVVVAVFVVMVAGRRYYEAPIAERVRDPWHPWLKPSGTIGQALGILALALFLFLWLYPMRKKLGRRAGKLGSVPHWLDVHIVAGLLVPVVAALHAGWRFHGLIGLGYVSMFVVCVSGVIGRYLYIHIPRGRNGVALSREEVASERRALVEAMARAASVAPEEIERRLVPHGAAASTHPLAVLRQMVVDDVGRSRSAASLARRLGLDPKAGREVVRLARREMALSQRARMLEGVQRVFRYWHAAHRPFAITALVAVTLHVIVAVVLGQTWFH